MIINAVFFILFSFFLLCSAVLSITSRKMIYSLLFAMITFLSVGLLFWLLGAIYNAMVQVLVYVVAVPILIAISIMLIKPNSFCINKLFVNRNMLLSIIGILFLILIIGIFFSLNFNLFEIMKNCTIYVNQYSALISISQNLLGIYPVLLIEFGLCVLMTVIGLSYYEK